MQELKLMYEMMRKVMGTLIEVTHMYESFMQTKDGQPFNHIISTSPSFTKDANLRYQPNEKNYNNKTHKQKEVIKSNAASKEPYSYRQRVSALRSIGRHLQKQQVEEVKNKQMKQTEYVGNKSKLSPFFIFLQQKRETMKKEYPQLTSVQLAKILSQVWKSMTQQQKKPFYLQNLTVKKSFEKQFKRYFDEVLKIQKSSEKVKSD